MKKKIIIILTVVLALGVIGGAIGIYFYTKPIKDFAGSKADISLTADDLFREFEKNESQATSRFVSDDKTIEVNGKVRDISKNSDGTSIITLKTSDQNGTVSCALTPEESSKAAKLKADMKVVVRGQCTGYQELIDKEVIMIRCGIVD